MTRARTSVKRALMLAMSGVLTLAGCIQSGSEEQQMAHNLARTAATSKDPMELMEAAEAAAASRDEAEHAALRSALRDESFLSRLDSDEEYDAPPKQLRLARVLHALSENRTEPADKTLAALAADGMFTSVEPRQFLLIRALIPVRPATPPAVAFWTAHAAPTTPYKHVTMDALADNGTEPAVALLEKSLADLAHDPQDRIAWMRDPVLRNRDNAVILAACERLVRGGLEEPLREDLVAALFDHREEWYLACDPPQPPRFEQSPGPAKEILRRIGEHALANIQLDPRTETAVRARLKAMGDKD